MFVPVVHAQVPAKIVQETVQVLVKNGAKFSPQLEQAVSRYYVQVVRKTGPIQSGWKESFILEHAKKFVSSRPELFTPALVKQLQEKLEKDLQRMLPSKKGTVPTLQQALERAAQQATVGAEFKLSVPEQMITMEQAVQYWAPGWRNQLFGIFDKQGLDAIEQALTNTDKLFFTVENGKVTFNSNDDEIWNYQEQFEIELRAILDKQGLAFTDRQGKLVLGGPGQINAPLAVPLKLLSVECFLAQYGRLPRERATDPVEKSFGLWISHFKTRYKGSTDPSVRSALDFFGKYTRSLQTPQERSQDLKEYVNGGGTLSSSPSHSRYDLYVAYTSYKSFLKKGSYKKRPEAKAAVEEYIRFFEEHFDKREQRTPQEWLSEAEQFKAAGGEFVCSQSAPSHKYFMAVYRYKRGLEAGIYPENSQYTDYIQFIDANRIRQISARKTLEEVYDSFLKYLKEFKTYPKVSGETAPLYKAVYYRLYENPQPENPQWEKLKRLDALARAAQRGEKPWERFDQADPLKRPRVSEQETESPRVEITSEELQVIKDVEKNYEELYKNFPVWMQDNHRYFIPTYNTITAFRNLERQVVTMGRKTEELSEILDTLNEMDLGITEDGFNRVIFRGNNLNNPKPTDFHVVNEHNGIPSKMSEQAVESLPPTIQVQVDELNYLTTLYLQPGTTADDIDAVIGQIRLPEGWEIRMGNHEIGFTDNGGLTRKAQDGWVHVHFESVAKGTEEEMYDLSYTLQINTKALIEGKNDQQIRSLYKRLFGNYYQR